MTLEIKKSIRMKANKKWIGLIVDMTIGPELLILSKRNQKRAMELFANCGALVEELSKDDKFKDQPKEFITEASTAIQHYYFQQVALDLLTLLENGFPEKKIVEKSSSIIQ